MSTIRTAIFQTFTLFGVHEWTVTDSAGSRTESLGTAATTTYWRIRLQKSGATAATAVLAKDLLTEIQTAMAQGSGLWTWGLSANGHVTARYNGAGASATFSFTSSSLERLVGHTGGVVTVAAGATHTFANPPTHALFMGGKSDDEFFRPQGQRFAGARMRSGQVYGWADGVQSYGRTFRVEWIPKDAATRSSEGVYATPYYPVAARWVSNSDGSATESPWSWVDFLLTSPTQRLAVLGGNYQEYLAGSVTTYAACYGEPEMYTAENSGLMVPGWEAYYWQDVALALNAWESP
jgi:hypothetical protein